MNHTIATKHVLEDVGETLGYLEIYTERKLQIAKLEAAEKTAKVTASLVTNLVLGAFLLIIFGTLSLALGFFLQQAMGISYAQAFLLLGGIQIVLLIIMITFREKLFTNPILKHTIQTLFR